ncbi:hypothetical protein XPA_001833 [Xanthoria parietina]
MLLYLPLVIKSIGWLPCKLSVPHDSSCNAHVDESQSCLSLHQNFTSQHSNSQAQQYDWEQANNTFIPERRSALSMPQHPSPGAQPTSTILYNMDKQVGYLDHHISELEQLADRLAPGCLFATRGAFMTKVTFFRITKPTCTPCGVDLANRVLTVQFKVRNLFNETTLEPLIAFAERQSRLMVETANMHIDEAKPFREARLVQGSDEAEEDPGNEAAKHTEAREQETAEDGQILHDTQRPMTPISPVSTPTLPFSVAITSLNTSTRHYIAKEGSQPFTLIFNHGTHHYDLVDTNHHPSYSLHTFHPLDLKIVAWAPGSLQVHTQTNDYVKKNGTGDYMNLSVENVEGLETLVEGLKASGVEALRMEL